MNYISEDTIAAVATAPGVAGIGIIRLSGSDALQITDKIFKTAGGKSLDLVNAETHTIHYGFIYDGDEMIDEVLVSVMLAPRSYTTENTVEINCHGGPFVIRRVLQTVIRNGARPAEPGEFTKRAFLNGRIDLTEAESVMDLIASGNEFARKNSLKTLRGSIYNEIHDLRDRIIHETAFIESALDDPEHYSLDGYPDELHKNVVELKNEIESMLSHADDGKILSEGINTCLVGKPNVGKSSLLNLLAGEDKAIVTDVPGTTRDAVEVKIQFGGLTLNMMDTAGIRDTNDTVEKIGVEKSRNAINNSDLILFVLDSSSKLEDDDIEIFDSINGKNCIIILNKSDLDPVLTVDKIHEMTDAPVVVVSARNEDGMEDLLHLVREMFLKGEISNNDQVYITNERQLSELRHVNDSLSLVLRSIEDGMTEDFFTVDLMDAYDRLGSVIGEETGDDLADRIFSEFCMGK
ncbi:tRNA modification GTPase [Lachnospiraceae bacterium]|nr:tRNA modification GTPase [Lachnospiraceae bacterium]